MRSRRTTGVSSANTGLSRRERAMRRSNRITLAIATCVVIAIVCAVLWLAPGEDSKPLMTVYMQTGCAPCSRWADHLRSHGFRIQFGAAQELPQVRARFRLGPGFRGRHTAIVDGLFIEGHVPPSDIQKVLRAPDHWHIRGLVVPGLPKGAPGIGSFFGEQFVVYAVYDSGLMRPLTIHNHFF